MAKLSGQIGKAIEELIDILPIDDAITKMRNIYTILDDKNTNQMEYGEEVVKLLDELKNENIER